MRLTRMLRLGSAGADVLAVKQRLMELGYYAPRITQLRTDVFGADTLCAVCAFQTRSGLPADGVVGPQTALSLFGEDAGAKQSDVNGISAQIGKNAAGEILAALEGAQENRRLIVLNALNFAFDPALPREYPVSLYIRGGNLYNTDLQPNVITLERIALGARRQPEFYDGGRREMMERAVLKHPLITGADCSGGVVGLLRRAGVVPPAFDLAADGFASNRNYRHIESTALLPADLLHRKGHIGLYAGGGYAVEWMGGAYGCQLTRISARRGWNFVKQTTDRFGGWTGFLRPACYKEGESCGNGTS